MNGQPQILDVDFSIHLEGRFHVGNGYATALVDRSLQRRRRGDDRPGVPFVPGSQIKGLLRHQCERLAATLGCGVIDPHAAGRDLLPHFRPLAALKAPLVDRLFGTRYQGDCLFVEDALPKETTPEVRNRARTALDRLTGTARDATLFVTEVAEAERTILAGRLEARHPHGVLTGNADAAGFPFEYALLLAGLLSLDRLGGNRSCGLGSCYIEIIQILHNSTPCEAEDKLGTFAEEDWAGLVQLYREEQR